MAQLTPPGDYVWRFQLAEKPPAVSPLSPGRELLRVQWEQLLGLTIPFLQDEPLRVDGFALRREPDTVLPVWLDDPRWRRT
jgi:hypothetical protein